MMKKIKLLCVIDDVFPPRSGGDQAVLNALRLLQDKVELHVYCVTAKDMYNCKTKIESVLSNTVVHVFNLHKRDRYIITEAIFRRIRRLLQSLAKVSHFIPYRQLELGINLERIQPLYMDLNSYIRSNYIDIVQFEFITSLFQGLGIVEENVKKVFVHHELQFVVDKQRASNLDDANFKLVYGINKNREIAALNSYDAVLTLSEDDKIRLENAGVLKPVFSSFAQISISANNASQPTEADIKYQDIVFVGPYSHASNRLGMEWFLNCVWNSVLKRKPETILHIVGNWPEKVQVELTAKYKNLKFYGFVDDLGSVISGKIMIVPIRDGSGLRMKIFEAAQYSVPVVSCVVGAEGMGLEPGRHCYITDDAQVFADNVIELINDPDKALWMAKETKMHFETRFSDDAFVRSRMSCYEYLMSK